MVVGVTCEYILSIVPKVGITISWLYKLICITTKIEVQLVTMVMLCTKQSLVAVV